MREIAHPGAAIFLLDRDAVQPERAHLGPQLDRKAVGAVDLGGDRRDPVLGKVAHRRAQHVDLGAEIVVEHREAGVLHEFRIWRSGVGSHHPVASPVRYGSS